MSAEFPLFEKAWLRTTFELRAMTSSSRRSTCRFESEAERIIQILNDCDYDLLSRDAKIPRLAGLRRDSCSWSAFMVVDHLRRYNELAAETIGSLVSGGQSRNQQLGLPYLIPDEDANANVIDEFQESVWQYAGLVNNLSQSRYGLAGTGSIDHSIFGRLNAQRMHALTGFHLALHRRHIMKILAVEGVV